MFARLILAFLAVLCCVTLVRAEVLTQQGHVARKKVRVAQYTVMGQQELDSAGRPRGYSSEYLRRIAQLADWNLEYVPTTPGGALTLLQENKVDVVGFLTRTPEREAWFAYPQLYAGVGVTCVLALADNTSLPSNEVEALHQRRVGIVRNGNGNQLFRDFMQARGVSYVPVEYDETEDLVLALDVGEIDAAVTVRSPARASRKVLFEFAHYPFYFATHKQNTEILRDLEYAMGEIAVRYPGFTRKLYNTYMAVWSKTNVFFSVEEQKYLNSVKTLKVAYDPSWYPVEYRDEHTGQMKGLGREMLDIIQRKSGLVFDTAGEGDAQEFIGEFVKGKYDIIMGYPGDAAFVSGNMTSDPYLSMPMAFIGRRSTTTNTRTTAIKVAVPVYYSGTSRLVLKARPDYSIVFYPTSNDCVRAVLRGEVELTVENVFVAQHRILLAHPELTILDITTSTFAPQMIMRHGTSPVLASIIDKCIASISPSEMEDLFHKYAALTFKDAAQSRVEQDAFIGLMLALIAILLLTFFIWQQRRSNRAVRQALIQAEQASKAKTIFFKNLSHELRTPINAIMGLTASAMKSVDNRGKVLDKLQKATAASEHLLRLISDILDLSKIEAGKLPLVLDSENIRDKFDFLCEMIEEQCQDKNIRLMRIYDEQIHPWLINDKSKVDQVLLNILGNAVKFTPCHGAIVLEVRLVEVREGAQRIRYTVRDTGMGMTRATLDTILVPFERSESRGNREAEGVGLGIPIAQRLAALMGALLDVRSEEGKGTVVEFTLWCALGQPPVQETVADIDLLTGKRALLVEDVEINREIALEILTVAGVQTDDVENGQQAVDAFTRSPAGHYDIIFMDVMMPVMNGYDATRAIRASAHPDAARIPVVALTANAFAEDAEDAISSGMNDHMPKPFTAEALYAMMRKYVRE